MKSASSAQSVVKKVRLNSVANMLRKVVNMRNVCTSGLNLSCAKSGRSSVAQNQLLHLATELT